MRVLVACEFSGTVRDAFIRRGHDAWSCDLLPSESDFGPHIQGDVLGVLVDGWDLMVAHPPCTHLAVSGAGHFWRKKKEQKESLQFVRDLMYAPIQKICIENPVSVISTEIKKPSQIIHPYLFGHLEQKTTCLWLKGLPYLCATKNVKEEMDKLPANVRQRLHYLPPSKDRGKLRSKTYDGIAEAMADQWGNWERPTLFGVLAGDTDERGEILRPQKSGIIS